MRKPTTAKPKPERGPRDDRSSGEIRPAGPHARPELTDEGKTPGRGMFPSDDN
jgi:hypothetical protein